MFTIAGARLTKVWVLGDRLALLLQIGEVPAEG